MALFSEFPDVGSKKFALVSGEYPEYFTDFCQKPELEVQDFRTGCGERGVCGGSKPNLITVKVRKTAGKTLQKRGPKLVTSFKIRSPFRGSGVLSDTKLRLWMYRDECGAPQGPFSTAEMDN